MHIDRLPGPLSGKMRRYWTGKSHAFAKDLLIAGRSEPPHLGGIVILLDAGLDRLPVADGQLGSIAVQQSRGNHCFPDSCIGAGYEETAEHAERSLIARCCLSAGIRALMKLSRTGSVIFTFTEILSRAVPVGTLGGRIARTSKPARCNS